MGGYMCHGAMRRSEDNSVGSALSSTSTGVPGIKPWSSGLLSKHLYPLRYLTSFKFYIFEERSHRDSRPQTGLVAEHELQPSQVLGFEACATLSSRDWVVFGFETELRRLEVAL